MRWSILMVVGAVAWTGCVAGSTDPTPSSTQSASSALTVDTRTETTFAGSFTHGSSVIKFSSTTDAPGHATLRLEVNGQVFDAWIDQGTRKAHWDGHNGSLYEEDLAALKAFLPALGAYYHDVQPTSLHEDALVRRVSYWSEAPAGLTMPARDVDLSNVRTSGVKASPNGAPTTEEAATAVGPEAAHNGTDEDGIWYLHCNTYATATHDATSHCKTYESIYSGPNSTDCHGKCGPGCGFGTAGYTYDCHDHDRCGRVHGGSTDPWDSNCSDEFWEADDDFWNSIIGKCL